MGLIPIFAASLLLGFSGAVMPGSLLTVDIQESLRRGPKAGIFLVAGHAMLELALVAAVLFGLGSLIQLPAVKGTIGLLGGGFLSWMAYGSLKEAFGSGELRMEAAEGKKGLHPVILGITVSGSNPYWSLWWATAGAGALLLAAEKGVAGAISFYLGHILADLIWYEFVSIAVTRGKRLFSPLIYKSILAACGLFLLFLGGYFAYSGLRFLGIFRGGA